MNRLTSRVLKFAALAAVCGFATEASAGWTLEYNTQVSKGYCIVHESGWSIQVSSLSGTNIYLRQSLKAPTTVTELDFTEPITNASGTVYSLVEFSPATTTSRGVLDGKSWVTSVKLPSTVTVVGCQAFKGCTGLTELELPLSVTTIGIEAFSGCTNLKSLNLLSTGTLRALYRSSFTNCSSLTNDIVLGMSGSLTLDSSTGNGIFAGCTKIKDVTLGEGVPTCRNDDGLQIGGLPPMKFGCVFDGRG